MRPIHESLMLPSGGFWPDRTGPRVTVRWLGTAGFELRAGEHVLLLDPYVSRCSLARCVAAPLSSDETLVRLHCSRADAIVVGHTHFDHALDVPAIARTTGARVYGSRSATALCLGAGVTPSKIVDVEEALAGGGHAAYESEVGPFHLRFFASAHSKLMLGRVPLPGDIDDCDAVPMRLHRYRCGAVFGVEIRVFGRRIFHLGSAELVERTLDARDVDLLLLCVAGWTKGVDVPERVLRALRPDAVLLSHWDDFFRPLDEPLHALPALQMPTLVDRLQRAARDVRIGTVPLLGVTEV